SGVVKIEGDASRLVGGAAGERELVIALGRPDLLPAGADAVAPAAAKPGGVVFHETVRWLGGEAPPKTRSRPEDAPQKPKRETSEARRHPVALASFFLCRTKQTLPTRKGQYRCPLMRDRS